jgi:homoserine dehydrogenase
MASGRDYSEVLAEAQAQGYAEADPTADVEGYDALAKVLILASLVFGQTLKPEEVYRQGITAITGEQVRKADKNDQRIKLVASLVSHPGDAILEAKVAPVGLPLSDPLARVDGVMNAITIHSDTLQEVTVIGPGAGRLQTGQGLLADLLAIAKTT